MARSASPGSEGVADPNGGRQKSSSDTRAPPRQACIECRRRKIKCEGFGKSGCKTCKQAGVDCVFPPSQKRGPHKGYFEGISSRLDRIEDMLLSAQMEKTSQSERLSFDDEEGGRERKRRRRSKQHQRHSHDRTLNPVAAMLAPKSSTAPEIPFLSYKPRRPVSAIPTPPMSSPEESALGVLAQVAHELEPSACLSNGDYFGDPNVLPPDLAESLIDLYFIHVHPLFPVVDRREFLATYRRGSEAGTLKDHLAWAIFLAGSAYSNDPRIQEGPHSRIEIEKRLKYSCERAVEHENPTDLTLLQSLLLSQLFVAQRERKVALLSWTLNGRAVRLALKRRLNVNPTNEIDPETRRARISMWWCVYLVDIWDAARRGRPPSIHEGDYDVPVPPITDTASDEEVFFAKLVALTRILGQVLAFAYNDHQTSSSMTTIDLQTEEAVKELRSQLAQWYRVNSFSSLPSALSQDLHVAYLTVVILLHRPLLPTPLATAFADPILLLISKCASTIAHIAQTNGVSAAGSVPWRLYVPAVCYLTAGITLAQNALWSIHISGATPLRLSSKRDVLKLLDVFEQAEVRGHYTSGMSGMLLRIFHVSGVELTPPPELIVDIPGTGLPLPHEDPRFFASQLRPQSIVHDERPVSLPEKRFSAPSLQQLAPVLPVPRSSSLNEPPTNRKRKASETLTHVSSTSHGKPSGQQLPSITNLTGIDSGRRSPTVRSVSTYNSSRSSGSHAIGTNLYPPQAPSTAYHPMYATHNETPISGRVPSSSRPSWEPARPPSPPLPPLYDRRYSSEAPSYPPSSGQRDYPTPTHQPPPPQSTTAPYYPVHAHPPDPRRTSEEFYPRSISPSHSYEHHHIPSARPYPPEHAYPHRPPPPTLDPRYRHPTPPLSSAASNSPSWPPGYPYVGPLPPQQQPPQQGRYSDPATSPRSSVYAPTRWGGHHQSSSHHAPPNSEYYSHHPPGSSGRN